MRSLDAAVITEIGSDRVNLTMLGEFDFLSGIQRLWAGPEGHVLQYDSQNWTALGDVGAIDKVSESQGLTDSRTVVSLRVNSDSIDVVDVEDSRGRAATLILLILSDEGVTIGDIRFRMTMGRVNIDAQAQTDDNGKTVVNERLSLELLSETASLSRSFFTRMTYEAGLRIDSGDHGLEFVSDPDIGNTGLGRRRGPDRPGPRNRQRPF